MQSCLGGNAVTQMLACVSPASADAATSLSTLQYAMSARCVQLRPEVARITSEFDADPMLGDFEDRDTELNRRTIWIETSFGDVFARCVGDAADPMIFYVHGSGTKNSSMVWNELAVQLNTFSTDRRFFHVAIDCPGYGRSPGDRQTIRSYPGGLIAACVQALGRRSVVALVGSSQGAAAVFNAALEHSRLAHTLAVIHPVGHSPHRYTAISQPTLLIFDVEDAGHPVSVGRQMRKYLQKPHYFEFARSRDGDWVAGHTGEEMWKIIAKDWDTIRKRAGGGRRDDRMPECIRVAGGFNSWSLVHNDEILPWYGDAAPPPESADDSFHDTSDTWRAVLDPSTNTLSYVHEQTGRHSKFRPPGARVIVEHVGVGELSVADASKSSEISPLFEDIDAADSCDEQEREERLRIAAEEQFKQEIAQVDCTLCRKPLVEPIRLTRCRCALCGCCVERTVRYTRQCPACGSLVDLISDRPSSDVSEEFLQALAARETSTEIDAQRLYLTRLAQICKSVNRIVIEYGNISRGGGASKTSFTTFLKVVSAEGARMPKTLVSRVDFNINPGYSKPTATAKEPNNKSLGFTFEYAMARTYPCFMTAHFCGEVGLQLSIQYQVQEVAKVARRVIIEFTGPPPRRPIKVCLLERGELCNAWVRIHNGAAEVECLPEAALLRSQPTLQQAFR